LVHVFQTDYNVIQLDFQNNTVKTTKPPDEFL